MLIISLEIGVLILIGRMLFSKIKELPYSLRLFSWTSFWFSVWLSSSTSVRNSLWCYVVKRNESRPVQIFLFIISLQFASCDKRFCTNSLLALEASVLVRWSNIASKSARFFRSHISLIALSILGLNKRNVSLGFIYLIRTQNFPKN